MASLHNTGRDESLHSITSNVCTCGMFATTGITLKMKNLVDLLFEQFQNPVSHHPQNDKKIGKEV